MITPTRLSNGVLAVTLILAGFVFVALTVSLKLAISALLFLVLIHKLEYFLNSKIVGDRIRNPIWLTFVALIIGERLMGIHGLILAPVVLNYLRAEVLTVEMPPPVAEAPNSNIQALKKFEASKLGP